VREAARQSDGQVRQRDSGRSLWVVVAFVFLLAAAFYLALSIQQALNAGGDGSLPAERSSDVQPATAAVPPPNPTIAPKPNAAVQAAPSPIRGLAPAVGDPKLLSVLEAAAGGDSEHIAVAVRRVSDGRYAALNGDYQFYAASTFKLAVLYEAELRHARGELEYSDTIFISDEDAAEDLGTSGYLEFEDDGSITFQHLLEAMITVSDNSSAVALLHEFGANNIDDSLRELGAKAMTVSRVELWTSADDLALLMEAIYVGEGVTPVERDQMRNLLLAQSIRNGIPGALEDEIQSGLRVGNKTGTWPGAQHDVAFVEAQSGAYVIAILTDGSYEGWLALQRVAQAVHNTLDES
jgi:beta-lactamase class A